MRVAYRESGLVRRDSRSADLLLAPLYEAIQQAQAAISGPALQLPESPSAALQPVIIMDMTASQATLLAPAGQQGDKCRVG
jgi:hypothetical protein